MAIRGVLRLGEIALKVLDIDEAKEHYGARMGLHEMMIDDKGLVYYKAWDEQDHHSVVLREAGSAGMDYVAYKVYDDATLVSFQERITAFGLSVENVEAGVYPKSGRRLKFTLPSGHEMHLYAEKEQVGNSMGTLNPGVIPDEGVVRGFRINGLDHCMIAGPNLLENFKFFTEVLDFDLTEKIVAAENKQGLLFFLSCSSRAHDIAIADHPEPGLFHHASFRLESSQDHIHASDLIGKYRINVEMNDRHGVTRGKTVYFFDPSGNRNEIFCEGYTYYPDRPVLVWDTSDLAGAAFAQARHVPNSFLTAFT